jgi:TrpR-related protein YerC/YecD
MNKGEKWTSEKTDELFRAILSLKNSEECERFFRDILTLEEIKEIAVRLQLAKMIDSGLTYREIADKTKVSTATITRVADWLHHGKGGYRLVLDRLK